MTLQDAVTELVTEFGLLDCLEEWDDIIREQVREDDYDGLTEDHPRVQRYRELCRAVRAAVSVSHGS